MIKATTLNQITNKIIPSLLVPNILAWHFHFYQFSFNATSFRFRCAFALRWLTLEAIFDAFVVLGAPICLAARLSGAYPYWLWGWQSFHSMLIVPEVCHVTMRAAAHRWHVNDTCWHLWPRHPQLERAVYVLEDDISLVYSSWTPIRIWELTSPPPTCTTKHAACWLLTRLAACFVAFLIWTWQGNSVKYLCLQSSIACTYH
jgi:hypothetical protein